MEDDSDYDPKEFLLFALHHYGIPVLSAQGRLVHTANAYTIEVEGKNLYKLLSAGAVIAPFSDVDELCWFIKNG
jgi:hypothetical protein